MAGHPRGAAEKQIKGCKAVFGVTGSTTEAQHVSHKGQLGDLEVSQRPAPQQLAAQQDCSTTSSL